MKGHQISNHKKRIVLVSDMTWFGGAERYLELLISTISRERYEIVLICRPDCQFVDRVFEHCDQIIRLPLPGQFDYYPNFLQLQILALHHLPMLIHTYRTLQPDLIHVNQPGLPAGVVPIVAALMAKIPVVGTVHSPALPSQMILRSGKLRTPLIRLVYRLLRYPKIFVSLNSQDKYHQNFPRSYEQHFVVYNGLDLSLYSAADEKQKAAAKQRLFGRSDIQTLGFIGRITVEKGVDTLVQAFLILAQQFGDLRLIMVGDGTVPHSIQQQVTKNGLTDRIVLTGWTDDIMPVMDAFDIFALPTLREGLPYVVLEAMAKGLPVVASAVDGIPEQVIEGETGYLVSPRDPKRLAQAIRRLLEDKHWATQLGKNGRRRVETHFTLADSVIRTCNVYEKLLS